MANIWSCQSNLNKGELDPRLVGRIDLQAYYNGLQEATNVVSLVQGGMARRSGMKYLGTALGNGRLFRFAFNVEQQYLLVFSNLRIEIYKNGVLQTNINGSGNDYLVSPYTLAQLQDLDFVQSADTAIITHESHAPQELFRTSDTSWTIQAISLSAIPQFNFNDASSPTPTNEIQDVDFNNQNDGDRYKIGLNGILSDEVVFGGDQATNITNIREAILSLPNTANTGVTVTSSAIDKYQVTFSDDSADNWDLLTFSPTFTKATTFEVIVTEFQAGSSKKEDVWSATRGWPVTCVFHEGRLWFGGSTQRPQTLWGSRVNDFFNFDTGRGLDDEAVDVTLDTDQVNAIRGMISNRNLQIMTSGGEFYVQKSPITPGNVSVQAQTNYGSKRIRPVTIEGSTLYIQRTGKALRQFVFLDEFQAYSSTSVSILSPQLIVDPIEVKVSQGTEVTDTNYVYILNSNGEVTVYNSLQSEGVTSFTRWRSDGATGSIKSIAVVDDRLNFLVERTVNGSTDYLIEVEDENSYTDSNVRAVVNSDTLTGLGHLEGETVRVRADGAIQADEVVTSGQITINKVATEIEAGLNYTPVMTTMPLNLNLKDGPNAAVQKRVVRCALELYESLGVVVNGEKLPDKTIGLNQFDNIDGETRLEEVYLLGWSRDALVTITQDDPLPMTILSICNQVGV